MEPGLTILSLQNRFRYLAVIFCFVLATGTTRGLNSSAPQGLYRLRFYHTHTGQRLDIVYRRGHTYDVRAAAQLNEFLRDYRTGDVHQYDPRVFDLLWDLLLSLGRPGAEINVVCAYRTPQTNEYLRTHGHGVAKGSLHMQAMAVDIRIPGVPTAKLRDAALALRRGGVGYYAMSDFVHLDTGRVRRW